MADSSLYRPISELTVRPTDRLPVDRLRPSGQTIVGCLPVDDDLEKQAVLKINHLNRLRSQTCLLESCLLYIMHSVSLGPVRQRIFVQDEQLLS